MQTTVKWSDKAKAAENPNYRYTPEGMVYYNAFTPSMLPYSLQMYGPQVGVLVYGYVRVRVCLCMCMCVCIYVFV